MKLKLAITYGVIIWILVYLVSILIEPYFIEDIAYINVLIPLTLIITSTFFGILYIRQFNENEVLESFLLGVVFLFCDLGLNIIYVLISGNSMIISINPIHILSTGFIYILITTLLGYLAQMKVELN